MADTDTSQAPAQAPAPFSFLGGLANIAKRGLQAAAPAEVGAARAIENVPPPQIAPPPQVPQPPAAAPTAPPTPPTTPTPPTVAPSTVASSFIPPRATRSGAEIGKPWWPVEAAKNSPGPAAESQFNPSPRDAYRYIGQVGGYQAKFGAPSVAGPAQQVSMLAAGFAPLFDLISQGAFSRGFSEGNALQIQKKLGALKIQQEQFVMQSEMMHQAHQDLLLQYGDVFNALDKGWITEDVARHRLTVIAKASGDNQTEQQIEAYGTKGALAHLQREDAMMRTAMAGTTSLKKSKETAGERTEAEELSSLGYKTDISGQGMDPAFNLPGTQGEPKTGEQTAAADTGEETGGEDEGKAFEEAEKKKYAHIPGAQGGLTDDTLKAGRDVYNGDTDLNSYKSATARDLVKNIASDYRNRVTQIAHGPGDQESKLAKIGQLDPSAADKVRGLLDYSLNPETDIPAAHQARENMTALAHAINPNWKTSTFKIVQKYHDANTSEGLRVQRISSLDGALFSLNNVLERIPEGEKVPSRVMQQWLAGHYSGDPKWDELYTSLRDIAADTIAIQTGSGRPAVTLVNAMVAHMLPTNSPASIRAQALVDMRAAYGQVVTLRDQFRSEVGDPNAQIPFLGRDINDKFLAYMRQNPYTGEMPSDAPQSLLGVGKTPRELPSWIQRTTREHPGQELPPLTKAQIYQGWDKLDELNKLGTPEARQQAQWLRERLGYFADRGSI